MGSSTVSSQLCTTTFASTSAKGAVPTTTTVKTLAAEIVLILSASTPYATVTPQASTVTTTVPVTTVVTSNGVATTGTFTTTRTFTSTVVETSTVKSSSTTTFTSTTSSTSTLVIPTSQGFVPIYDSSGRTTNPDPPQKRDLAAIERKRSPLISPAGHHPHEKRTGGPTSAPKYPKSVTCVRYIKVRITVKLIIIKPTVTKTAAAASTSTSIVSKTVTSTSIIIPPGVTSTVTQSTTSTTTSTTTTTASSAVLISSTETVTQVSTTTSYAACATNNLLGPSLDNGKTVFGPYGYPDQASQQILDNSNSAYDCCVRCITTSNCYVSSYAVGDNVCSNVIAGPGEVCDPNQVAARIFENGDPPQSYSPTLSNGYCGQFVEGFIA
ncbi:MAG: hypothetical protein L6R37_005346 [Teloschistes peruensis]|nr:MAG: hypothetical protein L6R37_005346 [Teloschistes peruensis]